MAQSLESLLIQFLMPDNDARRQAEDKIKWLVKDPQVIIALVHHLRNAEMPNVRQLSAALLRKKVTGHWAKLSPKLRQLVKDSLLESITIEHSPPVRRASANVVSIIAKFAVPAGEWPDLMPFLFQNCQSAQEDHREAALIILRYFTGTIANLLEAHFPDLLSFLLKCLRDETSNRVRVASLKAFGSFLEFTRNWAEVVKFQEFIPIILNVSRQCLASGEEDTALIAFEIFDELIEAPIPLSGVPIEAMVHFCHEVYSGQNLEPNTRYQAIRTISWFAKYRFYYLRRHKLVIPILQAMCTLLAESTDRDDDNDLAPDRAAAEVIDNIAVTFFSKVVFPPVLEFASLNSQSVYPKFRKASVTALGVISKGCLDLMKYKLEPVLHIVLGALRDPEQMVRGAALWALGQFAEHLQPEIVSHYKSVLPCILNTLEDASDEVKEKSYCALAAFCENMVEEILPCLDPLMVRLLGALQNSPRDLQETCMSAIGSVASAAEQAFVPYAERVLELMKIFMVLTNDEDLRARAMATELVGITAMSVGRMRMEPIIPPFIEAAISGFGLESSVLREYTHGFCSNVAKIMGDGFAQYLPHVVPLAFSSCNLDDGSAVDINDFDELENITGFGGVSSDDEGHDEPRVRNINYGVLDEKAAATQAIGSFALHTKSSYAPYLEESQKILVRHSSYFHKDVRLQAIIALKYILTAVQAVFQGQNDSPTKAKEVLDTVMNIYVKTMTKDVNKEVVAQACMSTVDIIKDIGYMAVEPYMPWIVEATLVLLREKAACQKVVCLQIESGSESDDVDYVVHDVLMDAVSDLLPAFVKSMGCQFAPNFAKLFERLMKFTNDSSPQEDRIMVLLRLAKVAQDMGTPIASYIDAIMPLILKELVSPKAGNRRNAAFCAIELCKNGGEIILKYYGDLFCKLITLLGESESERINLIDLLNALAASNVINLDNFLGQLQQKLTIKSDRSVKHEKTSEVQLKSPPQLYC